MQRMIPFLFADFNFAFLRLQTKIGFSGLHSKQRLAFELDLSGTSCHFCGRSKMKTLSSPTFISLLLKPESRWLALFAALPLVVGSALAFWALDEKEWLLSLSVPSWILLFSLLSVPIAFSLIPNTLAGILAGYLLGMWGLAGMSLSFFLASVMGYFFGRRLDAGLREEIFRIWPAAKKSVENLQGNSVSVVMAFRLLPVPPFAIGNLLLAWLRVPLASFLTGSMAGMIPRMALVVWLGSRVDDVVFLMQHPMQVKEIQGFTLGAFLLALVLLVYCLRKKAV